MRRFNYFIPVLLFFTGGGFVTGQWLTPVDKECRIIFTVKNFGVNTSGVFSGLQGEIHFDPNDLAASSFNVSIDAATVDTDITARDNHLRKEYFNVTAYPKIFFVSRNVTGSGDRYTVTGRLTIKGITKEISFPFTATPAEKGYLFKGEFSINRRDFNVGGSGLVLGDKVNVSLTVFAK